ncbi:MULTISPECIES: SatD family protein [Dehalobacter]|jgi:hypothetical protein|uniref:Uncharacterized protein n=2 Tax=Dehalobacter restrictus TaxID=55583 RepID=A0A857DKC0_9FIRM|nr:MULTISPECIES: SatD family protein [Dehalobacter]AHF09999.1 hypothetical protein DEHRE_07815 [Dehalobacter restrictus DSM 9455]MCG1026480.1 hypothetical protein [Dehalobacter sp.]MDJ0306920.1 SatD family protein [Dehalobacter sp.]OCZ50802.1 hypothetical protein A7D23_14515 [Dehalobacter sp. TeCB1]QHA00596.1 hypothetical protein GQ588_08110 [Dehalobacter restrictus]
MLYTAVIADLVNSKKLPKSDREQIQRYMKMCLNVLNSIFQRSQEFAVIFSAGDEVQGLFKTPTAALLYVRLLKMLLAPLPIRCGFGVGDWDVRIPDGTSTEQDGPAYHLAREAILRIPERSGYDLLFNAKHENDLVINALLKTSDLLVRKQSLYQNNVLLLTEVIQPLFDQKAMDLPAFKRLPGLVSERYRQSYYQKTRIKAASIDDVSWINSEHIEPFAIFASESLQNKLTLKEVYKKGLSGKISNITNTSRQNVDNVIKSANIPEIREIDIVTLLMIHRTFER